MEKPNEDRVVLYHIPPSFYSQITRVVLSEKGISWKSIMVVAGPPFFDNYKPWYFKLNSNATVPTLTHDKETLQDSLDIAYFLEEQFKYNSLTPSQKKDITEMKEWISKMRNISFREITYGSSKLKFIGNFINILRIKNLKKMKKKDPSLSKIYDNKIQDIASFKKSVLNSDSISTQKKNLFHTLDQLNSHLKNKKFIAGDGYSLADAHWTVAIARLKFIGQNPLENRKFLSNWYEVMKTRTSFNQVWEYFKMSEVIPVITKRIILEIKNIFTS